jgi:lipoate-protein ligase A
MERVSSACETCEATKQQRKGQFSDIRPVTLVDNRNITDPYINLAIEEYLVREVDCSEQDLLLLYINEPCIVLGKNQSIYKEVNFDFLREPKLKLCRRISGGGTVYHDLGNLSFSIISKFADEKINNYRWFNKPVVEALQQIGVNAVMDERNNILCNGKKISGNAQFTNRKNIISHGTLLFDADLNTLRACLKPNDFTVETKAVASVSSSVMNLKGVAQGIATTTELKDYLQKALKADKVFSFTDEQWNTIEKSAEEKFKSFEWIYGRSPFTSIKKEGFTIDVEDGTIKDIQPQTLNFKLPALKGTRYAYPEIKKALENSNASGLSTTIF